MGYEIEIASVKLTLKIDGTFKLKNPPQNYGINIYENGKLHKLDEKSPNKVDGEKIIIPYLNEQFNINCDVDLKELMNQYSKLLKEIDYLNEYSLVKDCEVQKYIETLIEIAQRDRIALNQAKIYIDYLTSIVENAKEDLEYSKLLENVSKKIEVAQNNALFDVGGIGRDLENKSLDELKGIHAFLIEEYVRSNENDVIVSCFFNLKLEGVYTNNEKLADELIEKAQSALNLNDFEELLSISNVLYELDEREIK